MSTSRRRARATDKAELDNRLVDVVRSAFGDDQTVPVTDFTPDLWARAHQAGLLQIAAAAFPDSDSRLPDEVRRGVVANAMRNLRAVSELDAVQRLFEGAGIRWLVLKGPVLSQVIYRVRGVRAYGDIDVLVHPSDLEKAVDVLLAGSATLIDRNWAHIRSTGQSELSIELEHGTMLDLHWHPITNPLVRATIGLDVDLLFARAMQVELGGVTAPTLDGIDTICYTSLHAVLAGAHQLRWLIDVRECLAWADPDPQRLSARAEELGCAMAVEVMITRVASGLDPAVRRYWPRRSRTFWGRVTSVVDRLVAVDPAPNRYSGRGVFSSTRTTNAESFRACSAALRRASAAGRNRRLGTYDVSVLHREGGTDDDRRAWFDMARSHGKEALPATVTSEGTRRYADE